jgi:hypothetical protein
LATQQEVVTFIRETYKHELLEGPSFKINVEVEAGRQHSVYVGVTANEVQITAPVAWQKSVTADQILDSSTSMFGIVKVNGAYALKHNVLIADIDESELSVAFVVLADHADKLEKLLGLDDQF